MEGTGFEDIENIMERERLLYVIHMLIFNGAFVRY